MSLVRKSLVAAALVGSTLVGGALGAAMFSGAFAQASTAPSPSPGPTNTESTGTFHPNENPTHESHESAQREAQENASQMPTAP